MLNKVLVDVFDENRGNIEFCQTYWILWFQINFVLDVRLGVLSRNMLKSESQGVKLKSGLKYPRQVQSQTSIFV